MKLIFKLITAIIILVLFGIAGEMDYQHTTAQQEPKVQY
jgi:hypothetical protein